MEQAVPELNHTHRTIADIRVQEGPAAPTKYADVMITHYAYERGGIWHGAKAGEAVTNAERIKSAKYAPARGGRRVLIVPLCFETGG